MNHDETLRQALTDVIRAQRLLETFYQRARSMIREVESELRVADPRLHMLKCPGYELFSPTNLSLHRPEGWLRRWFAVFFAEPRFLEPQGVKDCSKLKLAYLLFNLDPQSVTEAELDLVLLHDFEGLEGRLQPWLETIWHRGLFDLDVPPDGWYGRPDPVDLGSGAFMRLQIHRIPLYRVKDRDALHQEVIERLMKRYVETG